MIVVVLEGLRIKGDLQAEEQVVDMLVWILFEVCCMKKRSFVIKMTKFLTSESMSDLRNLSWLSIVFAKS